MLHQVYPTSQKDSYSPSDIVTFEIIAPQTYVELNNITISGNLTVSGIANPLPDVRYDNMLGVHAFLNNFSISTAKLGTLENLSSYPRMVKNKRVASLTVGDLINSTKYIPELVVSDDSLTKYLMINTAPIANPYVDNGIAFSIIPDICLNRAVGTLLLAWDTVGTIRVSFRLVPSSEALYGVGVVASYNLSDLRLEYRTIPLQFKPLSPVTLEVCSEVRQLLNSTNVQINVNLPIAISSMHASFLNTTHENSLNYNNTEMEYPIGLNKVVYQFNDMTNAYIFPLETQEDILENFLDSVSNSTKNSVTLDKLVNGKNFGVGIGFADAISLSSQGFGVNITSGASGTNQYYIFMYFRSFLSV